MYKADQDLEEMIKQNGFKPLSFQEFFPVLKDSIMALVYMHLSNLVHRDIKPQNILKIMNKFYLGDYGIGINLYYDFKANQNCLYQVGKWHLGGTPNYWDPIFQQEFQLDNISNIEVDLFKTDIYSLGLTLFYTATGISVKDMNTRNYDQQISYNKIHELKLPIQIKQIILHI